jgi:hypothetical protein
MPCDTLAEAIDQLGGIARWVRWVVVQAAEHCCDELTAAQNALVELPAFASTVYLGKQFPAARAAAHSPALQVSTGFVAHPVPDEFPVRNARRTHLVPEMPENEVGILGGKLPFPEQDRVPGPSVGIQKVDCDGKTGADGD